LRRRHAKNSEKTGKSLTHQFLHWLFHGLGPEIRDLAQAHHSWGFPIAFVVAFSESFVGVSFIVPGTFILFSLGILISASHIGFWPIWCGAVMGAVLGDWISYWLGFHYRGAILHVWPFNRFEGQIRKGTAFFHRWGVWAIFIGRFLGPFRATVPLVAGVSEVEFWPFQSANVSSAMVWAFALLILPMGLLRHWFPGLLEWFS
jgi:membrane protein DedA with SNARE-associated domain